MYSYINTDAAHGLGGLIISDGGCTMPGDFGKAFDLNDDTHYKACLCTQRNDTSVELLSYSYIHHK